MCRVYFDISKEPFKFVLISSNHFHNNSYPDAFHGFLSFPGNFLDNALNYVTAASTQIISNCIQSFSTL
jgi:hypothetical protein